MKTKHILGTVTILVIIGGTIYAIKKSKDADKAESKAISFEEAEAIVSERNFDKKYDNQFTDIEDEFLEEYCKEDVKITAKLYADHVSEEEEHEDEEYEDIDETINGPTIDESLEIDYRHNKLANEEDEELRYDPNSKDARNQFIRMELAEWVPLEDAYATLEKLYEFPFKPKNDGDELLRTQIIDFRAQFFGYGSKWTQEVTFADIIIHYAKAAEFNVGESVRYWVEYFLGFNELDFTQPSHTIDEMLDALNNHTYFNEERLTFGLFGLTRESMDQAIKIANRNIDRSVTYEIEFNEFLKSCL